MKPLIIFGRSPFIDTVDVPALLQRYTTAGFNHFGRFASVDHLFQFDAPYNPGSAKTVHRVHYLPPCPGVTYYRAVSSDTPLIRQSKDKLPLYGRRYFTPSVALNWAINESYTHAYLIGVDNVETDTAFTHHDGIDGRSILSPKSHQAFKRYVAACNRFIKVYQCNPAVAKDWPVPYHSIEALYAGDHP